MVEDLCKIVATIAQAVRLPICDALKELLLIASFLFAACNDDFLRVKTLHQELVQVESLVARDEGNHEHAHDNLQPTEGRQPGKHCVSSEHSLAWDCTLLNA